MKRMMTVLAVTAGAFALLTPTASAASTATSETWMHGKLQAKVTCTRNGSVRKEHSYSCVITNYSSKYHAYMQTWAPRYNTHENPFGAGKSYSVLVANVKAGKKLDFQSHLGKSLPGGGNSFVASGPRRVL